MRKPSKKSYYQRMEEYLRNKPLLKDVLPLTKQKRCQSGTRRYPPKTGNCRAKQSRALKSRQFLKAILKTSQKSRAQIPKTVRFRQSIKAQVADLRESVADFNDAIDDIEDDDDEFYDAKQGSPKRMYRY
jgi:hypothetical protein